MLGRVLLSCLWLVVFGVQNIGAIVQCHDCNCANITNIYTVDKGVKSRSQFKDNMDETMKMLIKLEKKLDVIQTHLGLMENKTDAKTGWNRDSVVHFGEVRQPTNYVSPDLTLPALKAITVCTWNKIQKSDMYQMPLFSYALTGNSNEILINTQSSRGRIIICIGKSCKTAPYPDLFDNKWHHVCVAWKSETGQFSLYTDGKLHRTGTRLATGYTIKPDGIVILGQEQDTMGGSFQSEQALLGSLTGVYVWDRYLALTEIASCPRNATLYSWDRKPQIHGTTTVSNGDGPCTK